MPLQCDNQFVKKFPWALEHQEPTPMQPNPRLLYVNEALLHELALSDITRTQWLDCCANGKLLDGMQPVAQVYAGHQFGEFVPRLGDGRALLLGQHRCRDRSLWDLHLKGAGKTPFSRFGDGRAVLRSCIREFLASEALHHLGIPTTRALVLATSDEVVYRENIEYASTLLRVAPSHLRIGHLEYFAQQGNSAYVRALLDDVIDNHYPQVDAGDYGAWFEQVVTRTAELIAKWQAFGFCHGVLNTDNMSLLGLTIDYGPFGFLETFNPHHICNHSDPLGRYAYDQQPAVGLWNLRRLAQALNGVCERDTCEQFLTGYEDKILLHYSQWMYSKLGFRDIKESDPSFVRELFELMAVDKVDYTLFFRHLCRVTQQGELPSALLEILKSRSHWRHWLTGYQRRLQQESSSDTDRQAQMRGVNPVFVLRNWVAQEVIEAAQQGDMQPFESVMRLLSQPFEESSAESHFCQAPPPWADGLQVSCSS